MKTRFMHSLRTRLALGVALPVLVALVSVSLLHYWREHELVQGQIRLTASQLGQALTGSLRHAMIENDSEMIAMALQDVGGMESIQRVRLVDLSGRVRADSNPAGVGEVFRPDGPGCIECHQFPASQRPRTATLSRESGLLRAASPIDNQPECSRCHAEETKHLGVLLIDAPLSTLEEHLWEDLKIDLVVSSVIVLLMTLYVYMHMHWVVVRRVEAFGAPLADYSAGNFAARLPTGSPVRDELAHFASAFNRMADELDRHAREEARRSELRQQAIVEERKRIAKELHDGVAQILIYVNAKAMAIRLLLQNRKIGTAKEYLLQLEEASQRLLVDVREAILGLKMTGQITLGLIPALNDYVAYFSRLSNLTVEVDIGPGVERLPLSPETEVQLLRIVQEALSNVRKHTTASSACVSLRADGDTLELTVADNGHGFDPTEAQAEHEHHLGLQSMRERAEAVGGTFAVRSLPEAGTRIAVILPITCNQRSSNGEAHTARR